MKFHAASTTGLVKRNTKTVDLKIINVGMTTEEIEVLKPISQLRFDYDTTMTKN